jgi:hypothetical protein
VLLERTGFFVGKPPQNDRKKQVSHYPVIAMERSVQGQCAVASRIRAARNDGMIPIKVQITFNSFARRTNPLFLISFALPAFTGARLK